MLTAQSPAQCDAVARNSNKFRHRIVADINAAANGIFDHDIKIKDRRLFVHDPDCRTLLKDAIYQMTAMPRPTPLVMEPIIVPRTDKLPVIVRIWPFDGPAHQPGRSCRPLDAKCIEAKPGPPAAILAKAFHLTPSEAKLACITRAAPLPISPPAN